MLFRNQINNCLINSSRYLMANRYVKWRTNIYSHSMDLKGSRDDQIVTINPSLEFLPCIKLQLLTMDSKEFQFLTLRQYRWAFKVLGVIWKTLVRISHSSTSIRKWHPRKTQNQEWWLPLHRQWKHQSRTQSITFVIWVSLRWSYNTICFHSEPYPERNLYCPEPTQRTAR